eukprot:Blabericola_migrator_1__4359@NODE_2344_length_2909_cov_61_732231_g531_i1_p3_GENE_NODE_2344_length_2909_cov_61_732231_g531_i1NODE_2344_length_2909_cov_61_732231_g531_i1_p3_ORF_typecomplete_len236_score2_90DUF1700/PF08006_11/0_84DUF1129/PF06570_11/0_96DUF2371/PF10177_9/4_7e02DUF2371/PF10177_9/1_2DUF4728/PF15860_5/4_4e02DUF4728/PF15860_5/62_NODE_2344_length_2909_cov_61_732231_g531_i113132020
MTANSPLAVRGDVQSEYSVASAVRRPKGFSLLLKPSLRVHSATSHASQDFPRFSFEGADAPLLTWRDALCHPGRWPRVVLQMVAGHGWISARCQIQLCPMRFRDTEFEHRFKYRYTVLNLHPSRVAISFLVVVTLALFISGIVMESANFWGIYSRSVQGTWLILGCCVAILSIALAFFPFVPYLQPHTESAYYIICGIVRTHISSMNIYTWTDFRDPQPLVRLLLASSLGKEAQC